MKKWLQKCTLVPTGGVMSLLSEESCTAPPCAMRSLCWDQDGCIQLTNRPDVHRFYLVMSALIWRVPMKTTLDKAGSYEKTDTTIFSGADVIQKTRR